MRHATLVAAAGLALAVTVCALAPSPAEAQLATCGTPGNWFDGFVGFPTSSDRHYEGVRAVLTVQSAQVCDSDHSVFNYSSNGQPTPLGNFTYAWSMITDPTSGGWVQSGYFRSYNQSLTNFSQVNDGHGYLHNAYTAGPAVGSTHTYWQQYVPGGGIRSNVDTTILQTTPFNPFSQWSNGDWSPQFLNETRYRESDVPGTTGSHMHWSGLQVQRFSDDAFVDVPCDLLTSPSDDSARWALQSTGCTSFDIWTK